MTLPIRTLLSGALLLGAIVLPPPARAIGPDYKRPDIVLSPDYHTAAPGAGARTAPLDAWWDGFADPELSRIVQRAAAQNLDIAQAQDRFLQSRAQARADGAALAPNISAAGSVSAVQQSLLSPIGEIGSHLPGKPGAQVGDEIEKEVTPTGFGRIASQYAKQALMQKIRQAEKALIFTEFKDRVATLSAALSAGSSVRM